MSGYLVTAVDWEVNAGFFVSLMFPVVTRFFWPWHLSSWGWNTVTLELSIAGTLFPALLFRDFHVTSTALEWTQVTFLGLVIANVLWRMAMIWRIQRDGAESEEASPSPRKKEEHPGTASECAQSPGAPPP
jgi:hypothetical protein